MTVHELNSGDGVWLAFECRDLGYGVEDGSGVYIYRGREQWGKFTFEDTYDGQLIYLFEDEVIELEPAEREAIEAAQREWPNAVHVTATAKVESAS